MEGKRQVILGLSKDETLTFRQAQGDTLKKH